MAEDFTISFPPPRIQPLGAPSPGDQQVGGEGNRHCSRAHRPAPLFYHHPLATAEK